MMTADKRWFYGWTVLNVPTPHPQSLSPLRGEGNAFPCSSEFLQPTEKVEGPSRLSSVASCWS